MFNGCYIVNKIGLVKALKRGEVVFYPTESVFGLGCDPDNEKAVQRLLEIKSRSWKKGLILVAANYLQLVKYIDDSYLNIYKRVNLFFNPHKLITWVVPAKHNTPFWLTGVFSSIAVRCSNFIPLQQLCLDFGKPIISTSANVSGTPPARSINELYKLSCYFSIPIMNEKVGYFISPSKIVDIISGLTIRH